LWLAGLPAAANAQTFNPFPGLRPPNDVPSVPPGPAQSIAPPSANAAPAAPAPAAPKGPMLQSLPPAGSGAFAENVSSGQDEAERDFDFVSDRLVRVRRQIRRLDDMVWAENDPRNVRLLISARDCLRGQEQNLSGRLVLGLRVTAPPVIAKRSWSASRLCSGLGLWAFQT